MKITQPKELGMFVRTRRQQLGLSQSDVAERAGTTRQWLSRFEQGHSDVSLGNAFAILKVLELELGEYIDPATIAVQEPDSAHTIIHEVVRSIPSDVYAPTGFAGEDTAGVRRGRLQLLRERDALSNLSGWASTKLQGRNESEHEISAAPSTLQAPSESTATSETSNTQGQEQNSELPASRFPQDSQTLPRRTKYSVDADIARIAKSSLFKRS